MLHTSVILWLYLKRYRKQKTLSISSSILLAPSGAPVFTLIESSYKIHVKKDEQKNASKPKHICYIFEKLGFQRCQIWHISMCQSHSTRPHNAKKLFTSSFQVRFLTIRFTKVTATSSKSYVAVNFFFSPLREVLGACFGPESPSDPHLEHLFLSLFRLKEPERGSIPNHPTTYSFECSKPFNAMGIWNIIRH